MNGEGDLQFYQRVRLLEQRYEMENQLMEFVRKGQVQQIRLTLGNLPQSALERRVDTTRDAKNYSIILNTLMRKAAEQGGVHPIYIDRLSAEYALRIEQTVHWDAFLTLWADMAQGYCQLVRKHTTNKLSPLVQKVVARIDFDLTADLSLRAAARTLNVNASYLSALFHRETGRTVTEYVNSVRMEAAARLLQTTHLQIQTVAQHCGMSDVNYFSKLFKKHHGLTPRRFRELQHQFLSK